MNDHNIYIENSILKDLREKNENWEKWFDFLVLDRHFCSNHDNLKDMENQSSSILKVSAEGSNPVWVLSNVWLADKEEIYDGEATEIGELMSEYYFRINFCPYCGKELIV